MRAAAAAQEDRLPCSNRRLAVRLPKTALQAKRVGKPARRLFGHVIRTKELSRGASLGQHVHDAFRGTENGIDHVVVKIGGYVDAAIRNAIVGRRVRDQVFETAVAKL